jgi:lipopolysaccharide export system permease protein
LLWSVKEQRPEMIIKEGAFSNDIDGYSIKVNRKNNSTGALLDLMIYDHSEGKGNVSVTLADSGFLNMSEDKQFMVLTLHNGESYTDVQPGSRETKKTYPFRREKFSRQEVVINVKDFSLQRADESFFKDGYRMLKNSQLSYTVDSLSEIYTEKIKQTTLTINYIGPLNESIQNEFRDDSIKSDHYAKLDAHPIDMDAFYEKLSVEKKRMIIESAQRTAQANQRNLMQFDSEIYNRMKWINRHEIEWHRKYTLSLACIIFFFIGAPLGAIIRKGGFGLPVVVSVLMFISYYLVSMIGENFAREDVVLVSGAMWFSTFLYLAIGAFLSHQAITDSLLLSREAYTKFFGRLLPTFSILKNKKGK